MDRVLTEAFYAAPGQPSPEAWAARVISLAGQYQVWTSRTTLQSRPTNICRPFPRWTDAAYAAMEAADQMARAGWVECDPRPWGWRRALGDRYHPHLDRGEGPRWELPQPRPFPLADVGRWVANERYLLQQDYAGPRLRILHNRSHLLATRPDRTAVTLPEPVSTALSQWFLSTSGAEIEFEAILLEESEALILLDVIPAPELPQTRLERWKPITQTLFLSPLHVAPTAWSRAGKERLWETAQAELWEGIRFDRVDIGYGNGPSEFDFRALLWQFDHYLVDTLLPKQRGRPRTLTVKFPTNEGEWVRLGAVSGAGLSPADWRTLERFRDCGADAVVCVRYLYWTNHGGGEYPGQLVGGRVHTVEPRLCRRDCVDVGVRTAQGTRYLF